jgi:hypothetical protein
LLVKIPEEKVSEQGPPIKGRIPKFHHPGSFAKGGPNSIKDVHGRDETLCEFLVAVVGVV